MRRKKRGLLYVWIGFIVLLGGVGYYIYNSSYFERESPKIGIAKKIYWNLKEPLQLVLQDNSGIKSYSVTMSSGSKKVTLDKHELTNPKKEVVLRLKAPIDMDFPKKHARIDIVVRDKSLWKFTGNSTTKSVDVVIDKKRPNLYLVTNSYAIAKGGSALVVFHCSDENLQDFYIQTNFGKKFLAAPFYKKNFYIALIAWPVMQERFRADIVAFDKAGNRAKVHIPLYWKKRKYKRSVIKLTKKFLEGKVAILAEEYPETAGMSLLEKFKFVNETLRKRNEDLIHKLSSVVPQKRVQNVSIKPFYPLKNGARVASFGTHRFYYYNGKFVSDSYHLGLDLASVRHAPIKASNKGIVKFASNNGIYGNMPLVSHGLGLYTLYGHCSTLFVKKDDRVQRGQVIAKTGKTGLALGDHLHFGVLVQGVEVRPQEWMDKKWIRDNITTIIHDAKKIIDSE